MQQPAFFDQSLQSETSAKGRDVDESGDFAPLQIRGLPAAHADGKSEFQSLAKALRISWNRHIKAGVEAQRIQVK